MPRIYTEIRIAHADQQTKEQYERLLDEALKEMGYRNRNEWIMDKSRQIIGEAELKRMRQKKPK
jgi:metal-responsive CopG/Arc/MetJ family transcriptional regulator